MIVFSMFLTAVLAVTSKPSEAAAAATSALLLDEALVAHVNQHGKT